MPDRVARGFDLLQMSSRIIGEGEMADMIRRCETGNAKRWSSWASLKVSPLKVSNRPVGQRWDDGISQ